MFLTICIDFDELLMDNVFANIGENWERVWEEPLENKLLLWSVPDNNLLKAVGNSLGSRASSVEFIIYVFPLPRLSLGPQGRCFVGESYVSCMIEKVSPEEMNADVKSSERDPGARKSVWQFDDGTKMFVLWNSDWSAFLATYNGDFGEEAKKLIGLRAASFENAGRIALDTISMVHSYDVCCAAEIRTSRSNCSDSSVARFDGQKAILDPSFKVFADTLHAPCRFQFSAQCLHVEDCTRVGRIVYRGQINLDRVRQSLPSAEPLYFFLADGLYAQSGHYVHIQACLTCPLDGTREEMIKFFQAALLKAMATGRHVDKTVHEGKDSLVAAIIRNQLDVRDFLDVWQVT